MASGKFGSLLNQTSSVGGVLHIVCYTTQRCIDFVGNDGMMSSFDEFKGLFFSSLPYQ